MGAKKKKMGVKGKLQLDEELEVEVEVVEATSPIYLPSFLNLKF